MGTPIHTFTSLSDQDLLASVARLASHERQATAALIASLAELDARRLFLREGCSSLFTYCTRVLHLSEHAAYGRIEAARVARRFPVMLERLEEGALTLTAVGLLAPHLTPQNHLALLDAARHRSKREVEQIVAALRPKADVPATVRKLPAPVAVRSTAPAPAGAAIEAASSEHPAPLDRSTPPRAPRQPPVQPLAPRRYKVQFTLDERGVELLHRAQALMRHRRPDGDIAAIVTEALALLVGHIEKTKAAATSRPRNGSRPVRPRSRTIPAAVRRNVWARDQGRCAFVGAEGQRCTETGFLEFHHVRPYADGGPAVVENIELRCRAHNQYESERHFGGSQWTAREARGMYCMVSTRSGPSLPERFDRISRDGRSPENPHRYGQTMHVRLASGFGRAQSRKAGVYR